MHKKLILILLFIANCAFAQTHETWELRENNEGVKIFTGDIAGSKIKAIKVECELTATLSQVVAALMDVRNSEEWLYHTAGNAVIKQVSPAELYYYSLVEMPWPVSNRDFIAHLKVSQDAVARVVTIEAPCVPDLVPLKPKIVRIANSTGRWVLTPSGRNEVKITYTLHADPGGNIPAWLTNLFVTQGPSQSFKKLKAHIQKPVYKNARLDYIID